MLIKKPLEYAAEGGKNHERSEQTITVFFSRSKDNLCCYENFEGERTRDADERADNPS